MLEKLFEWPACGVDQTAPEFDNSTFYPAEDLFRYDPTCTTDTDQQHLSDSSEPVSKSRQVLISEAQDTITRWRHAPCMWNVGQSVCHPIIHRPIPRYPPGYDYGADYPPPVGGRTPDESTTDTTPALTDSQSEPFCSPATEDTFTCVSDSLRHENTIQTQPPPWPQASYFSTYLSQGSLDENEFAPRSVQKTQAQTSGHYQISSIHVVEHPTLVTHVVPLKYSREHYNALLQAHGPVPREIKTPSDKNPYSFVALDRRGCYPVVSITEICGRLSDITVDLNGTITILKKENFCRVPGCGYWSKDAGRVPRHRLTHFNDRGFECRNPFRKGSDAPKHKQCQLGPGQYLTRIDLFKKHFRAASCKAYAPSFGQVPQRDLWHGPDTVDELYLLPFTRNVHVPSILRTPKL